MASNYPSSLDSFTNPTSTDSLDSPNHANQHADANDAIEAIETKLGIGASPAGSAVAGQVLVASTGGTTSWSTVGTAGINSTGGTAGYNLTATTGGAVTWLPSSTIIPIASGGTAARTFQAGDQGKILEFDGTFTVTIPADSTTNFDTGTTLNVLNIGSGTITIAAAGSAVVNGSPGLKLSTQWAGASIIKRSANTWVAVGDLSA